MVLSQFFLRLGCHVVQGRNRAAPEVVLIYEELYLNLQLVHTIFTQQAEDLVVLGIFMGWKHGRGVFVVYFFIYVFLFRIIFYLLLQIEMMNLCLALLFQLILTRYACLGMLGICFMPLGTAWVCIIVLSKDPLLWILECFHACLCPGTVLGSALFGCYYSCRTLYHLTSCDKKVEQP